MLTKSGILSLVTLSSMLVQPSISYAAPMSTPESKFLISASAAAGARSDVQLNSSIQELWTRYLQESQSESSQERETNVKDAVVGMRLLTPGEADDYFQSARLIQSSDENGLATQMLNLAEHQMAGAQFSSCTAIGVGLTALVAGLIVGSYSFEHVNVCSGTQLPGYGPGFGNNATCVDSLGNPIHLSHPTSAVVGTVLGFGAALAGFALVVANNPCNGSK